MLLGILVLGSLNYAQSGRRAKEIKAPPAPPEQEANEPKAKTAIVPATTDDPPPVTAEKNQDYRCTDDGSLARILEPDDTAEPVVSTERSRHARW